MIDGTYAIQMRLPDAVHGGYAVLSASGDVVTATFTLDQVGGLNDAMEWLRGQFPPDDKDDGREKRKSGCRGGRGK